MLLELLAMGAIGYCFMTSSKKNYERRNTPCQYSSNLSQSDFEQIVKNAVRTIKNRRITIKSISNAIVNLTVTSKSGLSTWNVELDFNDWGKLTGVYRLHSDNTDSTIPNYLADLIAKEIRKRIP